MPTTTSPAQPRIRIAPDRLSAELELPTPRDGALPLTREQVLEALRAAGVVHGIDEAQVDIALASPGRRVRVAQGQPPQPGPDGAIEWLVEAGDAPRGPRERSDGRVDYYELGIICVVRAGDVLARLVPPGEGTPGVGVDGRPIPAKRGKEARFPRGQGVAAEGDQLKAAVDGHFSRVGDSVSVRAVFEVAENVDFSTGNIDFEGAVRVRGGVQQGFTVRSGGDVDIGGVVSGATIECKGHLRIGKGIQGAGRGTVRAGGSVIAKFIENADVRAGGDVLVTDGILQSQVAAGGRVSVAGQRGLIAGGHVRAGGEVTTAVLGAPFGTQTIVEVGVPPAVLDRLQEVRAELKRLLPELERAATAARMMKELKESGKASRLDPQMLARLVGSLQSLTERRGQLEGEIAELESALQHSRAGRVVARERVHANTVVRVGGAMKMVEEDLGPSRFIYDDETCGVRVTPL